MHAAVDKINHIYSSGERTIKLKGFRTLIVSDPLTANKSDPEEIEDREFQIKNVDQAEAICEVFRDKQFESISLQDCQIGSDSFGVLSTQLLPSKFLTALDLSYNVLGPSGLEMIANYLKTNEHLRHLDLSNNKLLGINVIRGRVEGKPELKGLSALSESLKYNKILEIIDLSNNFLGGVSPKIVKCYMDSKHFMDSTQEVDIDEIELCGNAAAHFIAEIIHFNKTLRVLNIAANNFQYTSFGDRVPLRQVSESIANTPSVRYACGGDSALVNLDKSFQKKRYSRSGATSTDETPIRHFDSLDWGKTVSTTHGGTALKKAFEESTTMLSLTPQYQASAISSNELYLGSSLRTNRHGALVERNSTRDLSCCGLTDMDCSIIAVELRRQGDVVPIGIRPESNSDNESDPNIPRFQDDSLSSLTSTFNGGRPLGLSKANLNQPIPHTLTQLDLSQNYSLGDLGLQELLRSFSSMRYRSPLTKLSLRDLGDGFTSVGIRHVAAMLDLAAKKPVAALVITDLDLSQNVSLFEPRRIPSEILISEIAIRGRIAAGLLAEEGSHFNPILQAVENLQRSPLHSLRLQSCGITAHAAKYVNFKRAPRLLDLSFNHRIKCDGAYTPVISRYDYVLHTHLSNPYSNTPL